MENGAGRRPEAVPHSQSTELVLGGCISHIHASKDFRTSRPGLLV